MLKDGTEIGIVDGLPQGTVQLTLAGQSHTQRTVGTLVVAQCQIDISQSVE